MQNTAYGEYADNEYNIWWNMQMSRWITMSPLHWLT